MTFTRTRKALSRLRSGVADAGTLAKERVRGSDLFRSDLDMSTFRGVRVRASRGGMLGGQAIPFVDPAFAFSDGTDWSDGTKWTDTPT